MYAMNWPDGAFGTASGADIASQPSSLLPHQPPPTNPLRSHHVKPSHNPPPEDCANLLDALQEWADVVGPKCLEENEVGLDDARFAAITNKLKGE
jgi:hypothetical protein